MTESPVEPLICKMAVPTIISMLITSIYNMADTFFVGRLGTSATGAVGVVFPRMALIQAVGFFFGQGSGNYISRQLGAQHREEAERMAATGFFSALCAGCVIMILGLLLRHPLAHLLGATDTILPYALDYMCIILIGAPYMTASLVLNNQLRLQGNAVYAMIGLVSGGVLNMALDPLFIFTFGMGIRGAALATILSQLVGFCLLLTGVYVSGGIRIRLCLFSPSPARYADLARGGIPSLCRQGLASIAVTCLNTAARPYGDAAIAAMSIVTRVSQFAGSAMIGFGQGFQPVCGFNYGARKYERVTGARGARLCFCTADHCGISGRRCRGYPHRCADAAAAVHLVPDHRLCRYEQYAASEHCHDAAGKHRCGGAAGIVLRPVRARSAAFLRSDRRAAMSGGERPVRVHPVDLRDGTGRAAALGRKKFA